MRYLIVSLLPQDIDQALRAAHLQAFNESISIKHLHLSYLPPFFLKPNHSISELISRISNFEFRISAVKFSSPKIFTASHHPTLALPLLPKQPLQNASENLKSQISNVVDFDFSVYKNQQIPPFDPHVSLSYNFTHTESLGNFDYPKEELSLSAPVLLEETSPTHWQVKNS